MSNLRGKTLLERGKTNFDRITENKNRLKAGFLFNQINLPVTELIIVADMIKTSSKINCSAHKLEQYIKVHLKLNS
jgi:hypothetical protein